MTDKYKLAFFVVLRNNIMAKGLELGKSMDEINSMAVDVMEECVDMVDIERAEKDYLKAKGAERALKERNNR